MSHNIFVNDKKHGTNAEFTIDTLILTNNYDTLYITYKDVVLGAQGVHAAPLLNS